jgi:hypothetical protein
VFFAVTEHNLFIINVLRDFLAGRSFWLRLSEAKPRWVNPCQPVLSLPSVNWAGLSNGSVSNKKKFT